MNEHLNANSSEVLEKFKELYGTDKQVLDNHLNRYENLAQMYLDRFEDTGSKLRFFSAPGRTEIAGNHTDHQLGKVITSSVNMDIIAAAQARDDNKIQLISEGYNVLGIIDLDDLTIQEQEKHKTSAMVRGVAKGLVDRGYKIGGFNCYSSSIVPAGSGLSSSAAFEILMTTIFNYLFNDGQVDSMEQAKIGQFAENVYFGKPSGLLDQSGCSIGGIISIDFQDKENPLVNEIDLNFEKYGYKMVITKTDKGHAGLTHEYAAIPEDMGKIANHFGKDVLNQVSPDDFFSSISELSRKFEDRAILRAIHFFTEEERTLEQIEALENGDFERFLDLVNESGRSSDVQLQNVLIPGNHDEQEAALALALSRKFIKEHDGKGACRIHGGGFGGTIQSYIRIEDLDAYVEMMEAVFSKDSCSIISIRPYGGIEI